MRYQEVIVSIRNKEKMRTYIAYFRDLIFRIEEEVPEVGAYLYIYKEHKCIYDSLQNDIAACKDLAFEEYDVPLNHWVEHPHDEI